MNTDVIRKDWVGRVVDARFRLLIWLGSSGQSSVFLCDLNENGEQRAAIKLFPATAPGARSCAADWAAAAELYHPHLIRVLHTGRDRFDDTEFHYVVTEYAGEVLSEILPERPLTPAEVKEMLGPIIDALTYLHQKGLVHGRLKPSNIMVVDDQLKLSVENIRGASAIPKPPQMLDIYDAPKGTFIKVSPASDIWSLGVTIVEALTRIPPAWNRSGASEPIVPSSVPAPFAQIAKECLRLDPALRCTLAEIRNSLQTGAPIPHRTAKSVAKPTRKRPVAILTTCAAVLLAIFAVVMIRSHQTESSPSDATEPPATSTAAPEQTAPPPETSTPQRAETPPPAPESQQTPAPVAQESPAQSPPETQASSPPAQTQPPPAVQGPVVHGSAVRGAVAQQVLPDVPANVRATIQGQVQVGIQVNVDTNGSVRDASIASQGQSKYFANLALQSAKSWKFTPAQANGQAVPSVWLLQFQFRQSGVDVTPTEQSP
jgi:TonB family protein